jgi:cytoskeletal protein CcmA (bactofilin family)
MSNTFRPSAPIKHTVIEEGTEFKGTLTSSCPVDVRGRIDGEVATPALTVSASGSVHGRAKVGSVKSEGVLSGEFDADTIELAGSVRDNTVIRARSLEVKLASERGKLQVTFGECELSVGDEPTEHDHVEPPALKAAEARVEAPPALSVAEAPPAMSVAEAFASVADLPSTAMAPAESIGAAAAAAVAATEEGDESDDDSQAGSGGKRRRKKKEAAPGENQETGWSHPPSQPPPAN